MRDADEKLYEALQEFFTDWVKCDHYDGQIGLDLGDGVTVAPGSSNFDTGGNSIPLHGLPIKMLRFIAKNLPAAVAERQRAMKEIIDQADYQVALINNAKEMI